MIPKKLNMFYWQNKIEKRLQKENLSVDMAALLIIRVLAPMLVSFGLSVCCFIYLSGLIRIIVFVALFGGIVSYLVACAIPLWRGELEE
jgi:hypothetical protein